MDKFKEFNMSQVFIPETLTISELFCNDKSLYKIPNYQRPYSWKDEQIEDLWNDLYDAFENDPDSPYFLGSIIVTQSDKGYQEVVDGQQRITTLMILFRVIQLMYPNINENNESPFDITKEKITKAIFTSSDMKHQRLRFETHINHQSDFDRYIVKNQALLEISKPNKKEIEKHIDKRFINTAFRFKEKFEENFIDDVQKVGEFVNYIFNKVEVIKILCSNRSFAIKLFRILNDRGLDLNQSDLIKSYLMSRLEPEVEQRFINSWERLENLLSGNDESDNIKLDDLFVIYQYYRLGENPKKSVSEELENIFEKDIKDGKTVIDIIESFVGFVGQYVNIIKENNKAIYSLRYIPWTMYWKSIVITAKHSSYQEYDRLCSAIRRFYYLAWIAGKTLSQIKQTSFNVIQAIKRKADIDSIESILNEKLVKDKILELSLSNLKDNIYNEAWSKPLFMSIEYSQTDDSVMRFIELNTKIHLEHILPQTKKEGWEHITDDLLETYVHTIGNLTLLSGPKNIDASNDKFDNKINVYRSPKQGYTSFLITQKIINDYNEGKFNKKWNEEAMKARWNWVCDEIEKLLTINLNSIKKNKN